MASGRSSASSARRKTRGADPREAPRRPVIDGVAITHPERVVYPGLSVTKLMVAEYYARVSERLLPFIAGRPLAILRCPEGLAGECFFQKHVGRRSIPGIDVVMIDESTGRNPYALVDNAEALVSLAQWNALELHAWGSTAPEIDRPDTLVFDLDPDAALPWGTVVDAARATRALLDTAGLASFVKTTGGKGLHVVVPLERRQSWDEAREFARGVALALVAKSPERFTATSGESNRRGRIFVDYLRNARGATAVAPYSLRARPGATVATPLSWDELSARVPPASFTIGTVPERIRRKRDPWTGYAARRQRLTASAWRVLRGR